MPFYSHRQIQNSQCDEISSHSFGLHEQRLFERAVVRCRVVDFDTFRVFSPKLQNTKLCYTLKISLSGDVPQQRFSENKSFNLFPEECRSLPLQELRTGNDGQVPAKRFNRGNKSRNDTFVGL